MRSIQKLIWTTVPWWTGRDLNPRPYGAGLVPSRKQGPVAGPAKRAIFGLTLSVYQADLPAHRKTRPTQRLLIGLLNGSFRSTVCLAKPCCLRSNQAEVRPSPPKITAAE